MELRILDRKQIAHIYDTYMKADFPPDELKPLSAMEQMMDRGIYECLGLYDGDRFAAYGFFVKNPERDTLLLDYLAVSSQVRGSGYGSRFLQEVKQFYKNRRGVLLECESERTSPDEEQRMIRRRRIAFYLRNGCQASLAKSRLFGVEYDILILPLQEAKLDVQAELEAIYRLMFPPKVFDAHAQIWNRSAHMRGAALWEENRFAEKASLCTALGLDGQLPGIISFVGAGGKTTSMYQLADELAEQGRRVLITTTTHIRKPERSPFLVLDDIGMLGRDGFSGRILTVGRQSEKSPEKLAAPAGLDDRAAMERLRELADVILIEADGAKGMPIKVPAEYEPVLVPWTELVIACAGLGAAGKPFGKVCFRMDTEGGWLHRSAEDLVTAEDLALLLMDERGSRRYASGLPMRIILNQADTEQEEQLAAEIVRALPKMLQSGCVMTSYEK